LIGFGILGQLLVFRQPTTPYWWLRPRRSWLDTCKPLWMASFRIIIEMNDGLKTGSGLRRKLRRWCYKWNSKRCETAGSSRLWRSCCAECKWEPARAHWAKTMSTVGVTLLMAVPWPYLQQHETFGQGYKATLFWRVFSSGLRNDLAILGPVVMDTHRYSCHAGSHQK